MKRGGRYYKANRGRATPAPFRESPPVHTVQPLTSPVVTAAPSTSSLPPEPDPAPRTDARVTEVLESLRVTDEVFYNQAGAGDQQQENQQRRHSSTESESQNDEVPASTDHAEYHHLDCTCVGPGCECTKESDASVDPPPRTAESYIKDSKMPITTLSLKAKDRALAHQPCILCMKLYPTYQCLGCYNVSYCSDKHQDEHWKIHSAICTPIMSARKLGGEAFGIPATMRTNQPVQLNTVLLKKSPIVIAPVDKRLHKRVPNTSLCLNCCCWFLIARPPYGNGGKCSKCRWPVCSPNCENEGRHSEYECNYLMKYRVSIGLLPANLVYDGILALRCLLLKNKEPKMFEELMALSNIAQIKERSSEALKEDSILVQFLLKGCQLETEMGLDEEFVLTFLKIIEFCTLIMPEFLFGKGKKTISVRYIFTMKNQFSEDCSPNTRWVLRYGLNINECYIKITAAMDLPPGEHVTVCWYTDSEFGSLARRRILNRRFTNACFCSRCVDATENGSEFGTFLCEECVDPECIGMTSLYGLLRPSRPLENDSFWTCSSEHCTVRITAAQMSNRLSGILQELEIIKDSRAYLMDFIHRNSNLLHPNHYLMVRAKHYYVASVINQIRVSRFEGVRLEEINDANTLVDELVEIHSLITPGQSIILGRLFFQRQMLTAISEIRCAFIEIYNHIRPRRDHNYIIIFMSLVKTQREAYNILKDDQDGTQNSDWAKLLKRIIEDTDMLFLHRHGGDSFTASQLRRLRSFFSCLTAEPEPERLAFIDDPEIFNFKLSHDHVPPIIARMDFQRPM